MGWVKDSIGNLKTRKNLNSHRNAKRFKEITSLFYGIFFQDEKKKVLKNNRYVELKCISQTKCTQTKNRFLPNYLLQNFLFYIIPALGDNILLMSAATRE